MNIQNVSTLKIHKLTEEQYQREKAAGRLDETALYLTPDNGSSGSNSSANCPIPTAVVRGDNIVFSRASSDLQFKNYKIVIQRIEGNSIVQESIQNLSGTASSYNIWRHVYDTACQSSVQDKLSLLLAARIITVYGVYSSSNGDIISSPNSITYAVETSSTTIEDQYPDEFIYDSDGYYYVYTSVSSTALKEDSVFWTAKEIEQDGDDILDDATFTFRQRASGTDKYATWIKCHTNGYSSGDTVVAFSHIGLAYSGAFGYYHVYRTTTIYVSTYVTCLIEGTQILMADGTSRNIEDVHGGDMIKAWDAANKEYIDVRCLGRHRTGYVSNFTVYAFDNGNSLTISGSHGVLTKQGFIRGISKWKIGDRGISSTGEEIELTGIREQIFDKKKKRYTLISENNTYFANGIVCGHSPKKTYDEYKSGYITAPISEEDIERIENQYELHRYNDGWKTDKEFKAEARNAQLVYDDAMNKIEVAKKRLSGNDYKSIKYVQGKLTEQEWAANVAECEKYRSMVNEYEEIANRSLEEFANIRERLGYARDPLSGAQVFKLVHAENNNLIRTKTNA